MTLQPKLNKCLCYCIFGVFVLDEDRHFATTKHGKMDKYVEVNERGEIDFDTLFSGGNEDILSVDKSVLSDDFDFEPVEKGNFRFGDFELVGHGEVTNEKCGTFSSYYGCLNVDLHDKITLDGKNFKGKIYARPIFHSCDKPSCPTCYKYGWAVRECLRVEARLAEASKRFGLVEHIAMTFSPKYYHLDYKALRALAIKFLKARGVVGGCLIFHGARYNLRKQWYWSPHFHVLGFILGGYGKCRGCSVAHTHACKGCGGFIDRNYRCYEKDGCVVKVMGKRKTVGGTAWYQLNHATVKVGVKRFHVATWFGNCSYRKLKVTVEMRKHVCPICQHDLVKIGYCGFKRFVTDRESPLFRRESFEDFEENGQPVWYLIVDNWSSGSYED